jgi:hypothetical protein
MATTKKPATKKPATKRTPPKPFDWEAWEAHQAKLEKDVHELLETLRGNRARIEQLEATGEELRHIFEAHEMPGLAVVAEAVVRRLVEPQCLRSTKVQG